MPKDHGIEAVFLDRDGVINENRDAHVCAWEEFRFLPGSLDAIAQLSAAGVRIFVVTNQAVINRGGMSHGQLHAIHERMSFEIRRHGGCIESVLYCPHRPEEGCTCRKPQPGLLLWAAREHRLDLAHTVVIGDALADIEAGKAAGCETVLVLTGRGRDQFTTAWKTGKTGFSLAPDLESAVDALLTRGLTEHASDRYALKPTVALAN
jgi:D-glycero-D-manno-heptose 1,7-bisphosphate phosphatase